MQYRPQIQEYRPFTPNGGLLTNGRHYRPTGRSAKSNMEQLGLLPTASNPEETKFRGISSFWSPRVGLSWSVTLYTDVSTALAVPSGKGTISHLNVAICSKLKIFHRLKRLCFHIKECPHVVEMVEGKLVKEGRK